MAAKPGDAKATLRQLMKQEKQKRIDSPFAKYTNTGQLQCSLCNQQLTSEIFWKAHINGREHTQKVRELKSTIRQSRTENTSNQPSSTSSASVQQRGIKRSHDVAVSETSAVISKRPSAASTSTSSQHSALPADFFDSGVSKSQINISQATTEEETPVSVTSTTVNTAISSSEGTSTLPEGFFDDPQLDARMRKVEYVDKMEVEWDAFTREMKQETTISEKIEANDDTERDFEREINETDELIKRWQKIEDMHNIKDSKFKVIKQHTATTKTENMQVEDDNDAEEDLEKELESMYNWRQKRS